MSNPKKLFKIKALIVAALFAVTFTNNAHAQDDPLLPDDNEFVYVALYLTLVTDSNIEFTFNTIPSYVNGIINPNVTELRVESTELNLLLLQNIKQDTMA